MNRLTKKIIETMPFGLCTSGDLANLEPGSDHVRYALVKRALADGDLISIRRGMYVLSPLYQKTKLSPYILSQLIYGPSYISLEAALSIHGWIPEAVSVISCVCAKASKTFDTPLGYFSYRRVPQKILYAGVRRIQDETGQSWMLATPLKALTDYVYERKRDWVSTEPLVNSLRIEEESLSELQTVHFEELADNYTSRRVLRFLDALQKELGL